MTILVTGGAGYIGSHTVLELINEGHQIIVLDNLSNSSLESIKRVEKLTGKSIPFYQASILDKNELRRVFEENKIEAVIDFAGLKSVNESIEKPFEYYKNNVIGTLTLLEVMKENNVKNFIFSSSATVYGEPGLIPISETSPIQKATSPYGNTKIIVENILTDIYKSDNEWNIVILRYFNPIGAHESGLIGEDPRGIPNNLLPYISQVALGKLKKLKVFGNNYNTPDGTGIRDYIHVVDLAKGHCKALKKLEPNSGLNIYNLGTGRGYSVLEVIETFKKASKKEINYDFYPPRKGDVAISYCDASKAERELGWKAEKNIQQMCEDSWRWQQLNPEGYKEK